MKNNKENRIISTIELAEMLGISRVAVFKRIKKGDIPAEKIGRNYVIRIKDIEHLLQETDEGISDEKKKDIEQTVAKVIKEYGETLHLLGKE
jgi:excisionase family DNA binding protein